MAWLIYPVLLIAGFIGLLVLGGLGFAHLGHGSGHGHHGGHAHHAGDVQIGSHGPAPAAHGHAHAGHAGHTGGHGHGGAHGHSHEGGASGGRGGDRSEGGAPGSSTVPGLMLLMPLLSPLNWFSWMLGAGAAGTLATLGHVPEPWTAVFAAGGAVGFNQGVVKPIWNAVFGFASIPAGNLEACILQTVEAVTSFNERGEGLVRVEIDGRTDDLLARLTDEELARGLRIRRGDRLLIEDVDTSANECRVSRA